MKVQGQSQVENKSFKEESKKRLKFKDKVKEQIKFQDKVKKKYMFKNKVKERVKIWGTKSVKMKV